MTCENCQKASERPWHEFTANCRGCWARGISRGPDFARVRESKFLDKPYLELLQRTSVTHQEARDAHAVDFMAQCHDGQTLESPRHAKLAGSDEAGRAMKASD